jgi:putative endonuclease
MTGGRRKGLRYEDRARRYLEDRGLSLLTQNFRKRGGEIDLVMRDAERICFVEVKYRDSTAYGGAAASITRAQQRRIVTTALHYLALHRELGKLAPRFDALLIQRLAGGEERIEWIKNAFYAE